MTTEVPHVAPARERNDGGGFRLGRRRLFGLLVGAPLALLPARKIARAIDAAIDAAEDQRVIDEYNELLSFEPGRFPLPSFLPRGLVAAQSLQATGGLGVASDQIAAQLDNDVELLGGQGPGLAEIGEELQEHSQGDVSIARRVDVHSSLHRSCGSCDGEGQPASCASDTVPVLIGELLDGGFRSRTYDRDLLAARFGRCAAVSMP